MKRLITGEVVFADQTLVEEYNKLTYTLNRELYRLSKSEVESSYARIMELTKLLGLIEQEQLELF